MLGIAVIPDYARMRWMARASNAGELRVLMQRLTACFQYVCDLIREDVRLIKVHIRAASLATGCEFSMKCDPMYYDLYQNTVLGSAHSLSL